jgi:hypothetical protein
MFAEATPIWSIERGLEVGRPAVEREEEGGLGGFHGGDDLEAGNGDRRAKSSGPGKVRAPSQ